MSMSSHRNVGLACWFAGLLVLTGAIGAGCGEGAPSAAGSGGENDAPEQMRVQKFIVPEGEQQQVSSNLEIIAADGIEIAGELLVDPTPGGDLALTAEDGDIELSGRVVVMDGTAEETGRTAKMGPAFQYVVSDDPQPGVSLILTAQRRDIRMRRIPLLQTGRGQNGAERFFSSGGPSIRGINGSRGGNIYLRAPTGTISLPTDRPSGDPAPFGLGDGGDGGNVTIRRVDFALAEGAHSLEVQGGDGGDSGRLYFDAASIVGVPTTDQLSTGPDLIDGGRGGNGGRAMWDNSIGGVLPGNSYRSPYIIDGLEAITFRGGFGGDGARYGGDGGDALYWGDRQLNKPGQKVTSAESVGGDGGDVFTSPVPLRTAAGGEGGGFVVWGTTGWLPFGERSTDRDLCCDGADGGDVLGEGGNGGDVLDGVLFITALGGAGGNQDGFVNRVRTLLPDIVDKTDIRVGVRSGGGGPGYGYGADDGDRECDGCPGGNGGDSGLATAKGGDAGSTPAGGVPGGIGGWGGNVWTVHRGEPGPAGNGDGPGDPGGQGNDVNIELGNGGAGTALEDAGPTGQHLGVIEPVLDVEPLKGSPCGEDEDEDEEKECDEEEEEEEEEEDEDSDEPEPSPEPDPDPPPEEEPEPDDDEIVCTPAVTNEYSLHVRYDYASGTGVRSREYWEDGYLDEAGGDPDTSLDDWVITLRNCEVRTDGLGETTESCTPETEVRASSFDASSQFHWLRTHCTDGGELRRSESGGGSEEVYYRDGSLAYTVSYDGTGAFFWCTTGGGAYSTAGCCKDPCDESSCEGDSFPAGPGSCHLGEGGCVKWVTDFDGDCSL
ncbi:MAG: hypothetical protein GY778_08255 [bacterium]|nr:hypothetical protein [bacterium]